MRGLDPRIHLEKASFQGMDCRVKPGNDSVTFLSYSSPIVVRS
jgi:hypothetical protein